MAQEHKDHEHNHEHEHNHNHDHHDHNHKHGECECGHDHGHNHGDGCGCGHDHENFDKSEFITKISIGAAFFILGFVLEKAAPWLNKSVAILAANDTIVGIVSIVCFGISYITVGFSIIKEAVEGVIKGDIFNEGMLMAVASLGAFAIKEYSEGCAVMLLFTVGEFLQSMAVANSRKSIKGMLEEKPEAVLVVRDEKEILLPPEEVKIDDLMIVKPGEKIILDGVVTVGNAEVDMAALTGESIPTSVMPGDDVLAGSVNIDGALTVKATKLYSDSTVAHILDMLEDAEEKKSHAEQFITRFARIYTPIVCLIALLIIVVPPLFFHGEWSEWIYRGLSALVVSCPCALVISIPLGFFGGLGACSKDGILVKGGNYLEMLSKCDTGVFDKTGTITSGKFEFVRCECKHCHCKDKKEHRELLRIIASCERYSTHPIAKSICLAFGQYADDCKVTDAKNYPGKGVSAVVDGVKYYVGNEKLMDDVGIDYDTTEIIGTAVYCCTDTEFLGNIVFADIIKEDSKDAIAQMHNCGVTKTIMLTGDKEPIAADIAKKAGIDQHYSKLLPDEKLKKVRELKESGCVVMYTGDGINDAPVLAESDLGIAMGGIGSDVAIEASDIVIMGDSLSKIPQGMRIAKKTVRIVRENIVFSLGIKILIIIGCAIGIFNENAMWLAVFGDVGVCLIAVANSLRVMRVPKIKNKR